MSDKLLVIFVNSFQALS